MNAKSIMLFYPNGIVVTSEVDIDAFRILARINRSVLDYVLSMQDDETGWIKGSRSFTGQFRVEWER